MKTRQLRNFWVMISVIIASLTLTSCEPDDYDDYGLVGYWTFQGNSDGSDYSSDYNEFFFAPDGSGTYSCYSENGYGPWTTYQITWWANNGYLTIDVPGWDTWSYTYDVTAGWLYLYPSYGGPYLIYRAD